VQFLESDLKEPKEIPTQQIPRDWHFAESDVDDTLAERFVLDTNAMEPRCHFRAGRRAERERLAALELEPNGPADAAIKKRALCAAVEMTLNFELLIPVGMSKGKPQPRER
jgi:hypothetical protein